VISETWSPVSSTALLSPVLATVTSHPETTAMVSVVPAWADGWVGRWMGGQVDGWIDR